VRESDRAKFDRYVDDFAALGSTPTRRDRHQRADRSASNLPGPRLGRSNDPQREAGMSVKTNAVGKTYAPSIYEVGREKVREYSLAVGETNPLHFDVQAAYRAGYADVVAPPMFAVVYSTPAIVTAVFDPDVGMNFALEVHGAQEFRWGPLVIAGDEITTRASVKDIYEHGGRGFYVFETVSVNERGETVCTGAWTDIVRSA
jgi:acyl dehydratase